MPQQSATSPQLPFSVIGSLNGVHMFGQNLEVQLTSARTEDTTVVWKSFHDRCPSRSPGGNDPLTVGIPGQPVPSLNPEPLCRRGL